MPPITTTPEPETMPAASPAAAPASDNTLTVTPTVERVAVGGRDMKLAPAVPTVGRILHYVPADGDAGVKAALVTRVYGPTDVEVAIFDAEQGVVFCRRTLTATPELDCVCWPAR